MVLEERLYDAYRKHCGLHLSVDEVQDLIRPDAEIQTRIANTIAGWTVGSGSEIGLGKMSIRELRKFYRECNR